MAEVRSKIKAADTTRKIVANTLERKDNGSSTTIEGGVQSNKKLAGKLRSPTSPSAPPNDSQNGIDSASRRPSDTAIDPLSQQILQRTTTSPAVYKLRSHYPDVTPAQSPTSPSDAHTIGKQNGETSQDTSGVSKPDKKKGVSFLSRFIGSTKRKGGNDGASDAGFEVDDSRREGMDAHLYVDNFSFSPQIPQPPAYIKVRAKFKKEKEFDRVFLAQELRFGADKKTPPTVGSNPAPQSGSAATQNPIWAIEFSKDGKHLAAGGQDRVVRVWAVIASSEERRAHERDESGSHTSEGYTKHLSAPVFRQECIREYKGHTATILDLSWSKNNFLLSSSMDKTVRLWHVSRNENLCTFKHSDFVPSVRFHPTDDRFFLAGSLDAKLRLWSIPDKSVAYTCTVPDMVTAVSFTPDGKTCIAGTLGGLCMFYDTEGLKWQAQVHVKSTRGQNAKGSKITGIQATYWPPGSESGEVKLLVSSNDSRLRIYNFKDKTLEMKCRGHENNCSQIRAAISDSSGHIICGSEDRKAYIWSTTTLEGDKKNQRPVEMFEAHNSIITCAVIAPLQTRKLLSASEDPIYDLCNPPPVTLVSQTESIRSSRAPVEANSAQPTPTPMDTTLQKAAQSPAYVARTAHPGGSIIVTADYTGAIKVFRQDCAFIKRIRMSETWDTASMKRNSGFGRPSSIISRSSRSGRDSISTQPPNDRITTWRQGISHGSFDSTNSSPRRSASPRKSLASLSLRQAHSSALGPASAPDLTETRPDGTPKTSMSLTRTTSAQSASQSEQSGPSPSKPKPADYESLLRPQPSESNPLAVYNGQSWLFWTNRGTSAMGRGQLDKERPGLESQHSQASQLSTLTDELSVQGSSEE
ncbi:hypothetical protein ACN47E_001880 [Coniothyrium glycines]